MEAHSTAPQHLYPRRWPWVVAAIVAVLVAGVAIWYFVIRDGGENPAEPGSVQGPSGAAFTVERPAGWESVSEDELDALPGSPLAILRQTDGTGIVIINTQPQTRASLPALAKELRTKLAQKIDDFRLVKSRIINVEAGQAISIDYARPSKGTANTLVVVPAGGHVYTLNTVVPAGPEAAAAARDVAAIIASFNA